MNNITSGAAGPARFRRILAIASTVVLSVTGAVAAANATSGDPVVVVVDSRPGTGGDGSAALEVQVDAPAAAAAAAAADTNVVPDGDGPHDSAIDAAADAAASDDAASDGPASDDSAPQADDASAAAAAADDGTADDGRGSLPPTTRAAVVGAPREPREIPEAVTMFRNLRSDRLGSEVYVQFRLEWVAPDDAIEGDWFTITFPEGFPMSMPPLSMRDANGDVVAIGTLEGREFRVTLQAPVNELTEVTGWAEFTLRYTGGEVDGATEPREFIYNGTMYILDIHNPGPGGGIPAHQFVGKTGTVSATVPEFVEFRIYTPAGPAESVRIQDNPGRGISLVCSLADYPSAPTPIIELIKYRNVLLNGNFDTITLTEEQIQQSCREGGFDITLPGLAEFEKYRLKLRGWINPGVRGQLTNRSVVTFDGTERNSQYTFANLTAESGAGGVRTPGISIEKYSVADGAIAGDYDAAPGKQLAANQPEALRFEIRNTGTDPLIDIVVTDVTTVGNAVLENLSCDFQRVGGPATGTTFAGPMLPGESFECTGTVPALGWAAAHTNLARVTAVGQTSTTPVADEDPWNATTPERPKPQIDIEKWSVEEGPEDGDFDGAPGKEIPLGAGIPLQFDIVNTGNEALVDIVVTDRIVAGQSRLVGLSCDFSDLGGPAGGTTWAGPFEPNGHFACTGTLSVTDAPGQAHQNEATVAATGAITGDAVSDADPWHGIVEPLWVSPQVIERDHLSSTGFELRTWLALGGAGVLAGTSLVLFAAWRRTRKDKGMEQ